MIPCAWEVTVPAEVCSNWDDYPTTTKDMALWMASTYLWAATGRQYGICPVTVRPNQSRIGEPAVYQDFAVIPGFQVGGGPFLFGGRWYNAGCSSACCGNNACALVLRGPVASIDEVLVDGEEVPSSSYRVDVTGGIYLLVRTDGECWPTCQNMAADYGEDDTFSVTYGLGRALPTALAIATAMLACQYAKHLSGAACALPAKMTRLSRQGVEVEIEAAGTNGESTGISEVDSVVRMLNPSRLASPGQILSPDLPENCDRITVWAGGS